MVKMIGFLFFAIFRPLFRAVHTPDLGLGRIRAIVEMRT